MGEEVDIFMAQLVRRRADQPWGFRIEGGYDTHAPLRIALVSPNSPSSQIGLQPGDVISKIFNRQTKFLSHKQATEIIGKVNGHELSLTVERNVPFSNQPPQQQQTYHAPFQPSQSSITIHPQRHNDFQNKIHQTSMPYTPLQQWTAPRRDHNHSEDVHFLPQSFKQTASIQLTHPSSPPHQPINFQQNPMHQSHYQPPRPPPHHLSQNHFKAQKPSPSRNKRYTEDDDYDDDKSPPPQSQTFRRLQNYMENNVPVSGPRGLPPPRSASTEQMKDQNRMQVIMPQQYNNPMSMYSSQNVLDTFSSQVNSMLSHE